MEEKMKKLGFGLMRLPLLDKTDANSIDVEQVKQMVDAFMEKGFTYFDTAWMYCAFNSESTAKTVLVDRYPREAYTLATKLHAGFVNSLGTEIIYLISRCKRPELPILTIICFMV